MWLKVHQQKRKTSEVKKAKGKKKVLILCVTEPYSLDSSLEKQCDMPVDAEAAHQSPQIPTQGTQWDSAASNLMKAVLEKVQTMQMTPQGVENVIIK